MQKSNVGNFYQSGDWKNEKHVPVIEAPDSVKADTPFDVTLSIGKEVPHPNTTGHHIRWIKLYFMPEDGKFVHEAGVAEFTVHGESPEGADKGSAYTDPFVTMRLKIGQPGLLVATSYCNIHGLWENARSISIA